LGVITVRACKSVVAMDTVIVAESETPAKQNGRSHRSARFISSS